jgi:hypothetical protein
MTMNPMAIKENLLLQSVYSFYRGNLDEVPGLINRFFYETTGNKPFETDLILDELFDDRRLRWEYLVRHYLEFHWTKQLPLASIYEQVWESIPFKRFPRFMALLKIHNYFESGKVNGGIYQTDYDQAIGQYNLGRLLDTIRQGCGDGRILVETHDDLFGVFPVVCDELIALMERFQPSTSWRQMFRDAVHEGKAAADNAGISMFSEKNAEFVSKLVMQEFFLPPTNAYRRGSLLHNFLERYPERASGTVQSLEHYANSLSDDELADFIFLYTGGQVLPEDPRAWMRLFIQSVETGKMLIPEV